MRIEELLGHLGQEVEAAVLNRAVRAFAEGSGAAAFGALHVSCADEAERACRDGFQAEFCDGLLPPLEQSKPAPFRITNLGARYEPGALAVAEAHFATDEAERGFKLLLVKISGHVAVDHASSPPSFGRVPRYGRDSTFCGALHALLDGAEGLPFTRDLRAQFGSGGVDRLAILGDAKRVLPEQRALMAALVSVRLQIRAAMDDAAQLEARGETAVVFLGALTLNQHGRESEVLTGVGLVDRRGGGCSRDYRGLGDDPSTLVAGFDGDRLRVAERAEL